MPRGAYMDDKARNTGREEGKNFVRNNPHAPTQDVVGTAGEGAVKYYRSDTTTRIADLGEYLEGFEEGYREGWEGETGGDGGESGS